MLTIGQITGNKSATGHVMVGIKEMTMTTQEKLLKILQRDYIEKYGAPDINTAMRDCMTDLFHIADREGVDLSARMYAAKEVYREEKEEQSNP